MDKKPITPEGQKKLREELDFIKNVKRQEIVDAILNKEICMVINTTEGRQSIKDSFSIRRSALEQSVFFTTTISGGLAIVESLEKGEQNWSYIALQDS